MCRDHVDLVIPIVEELESETSDKRILIFIVPASPHAHIYKSGVKDAYFVRIGRSTREAHNGVLRGALVKKNALEPWDRRIDSRTTLEEMDLVVFRDALNEMGILEPKRSLEDYLAETFRLSVFVPPMTGHIGLNVPSKPRNFALLMFGKEPTKFFLRSLFSSFSIYPGKDRSDPTAEREVITWTARNTSSKTY